LAAQGTGRSTGFHHLGAALSQGGDLGTGCGDACPGGLADVVVALVVDDELLGHEDDPVRVLVVGDPEGAHHPFGHHRFHQCHLRRNVLGSGQVGQKGPEVGDESGHLRLLEA